jgi:hypothetical protein
MLEENAESILGKHDAWLDGDAKMQKKKNIGIREPTPVAALHRLFGQRDERSLGQSARSDTPPRPRPFLRAGAAATNARRFLPRGSLPDSLRPRLLQAFKQPIPAPTPRPAPHQTQPQHRASVGGAARRGRIDDERRGRRRSGAAARARAGDAADGRAGATRRRAPLEAAAPVRRSAPELRPAASG